MNFDDIKSAWNNDNEGSNIVVPSSVDQLKTLQLPVEKLRKAMQMEFFVQLFSLILIAFMPKIFSLNQVMVIPFYAVYLVIIAISVQYYYKFRTFYKSLGTNTLSSKDNLYALYYEAKLNIEMYKAYTYTLLPFALIIGVMYTVGHKSGEITRLLAKAADHQGIALGLAASFVLLVLAITALTEEWISQVYGKYLKQIGQVLEQFKENA
ncbi:hypothetical protein SAMN05660461_3569 [Chitinophaga ginsengisegetis]|uniref:Uncharacterized protein n=1 Tax=Chitinophaga ginsengisegetis TaxID=393003 RepID=A0A1T5P2I0_9BACT|nr:hypothetical protein [Chitinophaga ginsengisegetis]SKD06816.1 hypothetical protein SAMN05660461_3569 [Chitinophaga ginsengisegetis]